MARPRRLRPLLLCGLALTSAGCFLSAPMTKVGKMGDQTPALPAATEPTVTFDTRLVEQPLGDEYLTRGVWKDLTDPLPHKLSALLRVNGVRVGVRSGSLPGELAKLAADDIALSPTLRRGKIDAPKPLPINGPLPACQFAVVPTLTNDPKAFSLERAECGLILSGTPTADGRVVVRCRWAVQHGEVRPRWTPTADGEFDRTEGRSAEGFDPLNFEVTLAADEVLVVGTTAKPDGTLGGAYFTHEGKQRAAVVRAR